VAGEELHDLIEGGVLEGGLHENVNGSSIDVRLGGEFQFELGPFVGGIEPTRLGTKEGFRYHIVDVEKEVLVEPGQFFLAHTMEKFNLPDNTSAFFKLRSSVARSGLNHMLAGWCDPGFHNSHLTLEFVNVTQYHTLILEPGMRIGQVIFFRHEPVSEELSYRTKGRYNNSNGVVTSKGA